MSVEADIQHCIYEGAWNSLLQWELLCQNLSLMKWVQSSQSKTQNRFSMYCLNSWPALVHEPEYSAVVSTSPGCNSLIKFENSHIAFAFPQVIQTLCIRFRMQTLLSHLSSIISAFCSRWHFRLLQEAEDWDSFRNMKAKINHSSEAALGLLQ